jgi:hypothetical protein
MRRSARRRTIPDILERLPGRKITPCRQAPWSCTTEESEYRHRHLLRPHRRAPCCRRAAVGGHKHGLKDSPACNSASAAHSSADVTTRPWHLSPLSATTGLTHRSKYQLCRRRLISKVTKQREHR